MLEPELLDLLAKIDTPTVCNAIEVAQGRRGYDRFTHQPVVAAIAGLPACFGVARTARIRTSRPPRSPSESAARRLDYYRYMAAGARPALAVVEDCDGAASRGAFWGEVNTTLHKGLGLGATLTNGLVRDLDDLAPGYQVLAGGVGPSHAFAHVIDFGGAVEVFGLKIEPGDFIHADRHGAVIIPPDLLPRLVAAIGNVQAAEALLLEPARRPDFDIAALEQAWGAFTARGV